MKCTKCGAEKKYELKFDHEICPNCRLGEYTVAAIAKNTLDIINSALAYSPKEKVDWNAELKELKR